MFLARHKYLGLELFGSFFMCRKELLFRNPCFKMEWFRSKIIAQCSSNGQLYVEEVAQEGFSVTRQLSVGNIGNIC